MTNHTPLPWKATWAPGAYFKDGNKDDRWTIEPLDMIDSKFECGKLYKPDAQFIVKAVNCHYELLEACKEALTLLKEYDQFCESEYNDNISYDFLEEAIKNGVSEETTRSDNDEAEAKP